jgi:light-regulated signal transduction histidine kinase (bacteriophytochrome)
MSSKRAGKAAPVLPDQARSAADLEARLAERTIERDEAARADAIAELARTDAELIARLAERDDIARHDAIIELARTNEELKKQLARRTIERDEAASDKARIELSRTDLIEAQHRRHALELEALNAELESFSYSVSHDLRAPVRAILGYSAAIREDYGPTLDDEGRRLLSVVESEAARMGELIDDLLAFSRLGRQQMAVADVPMTSLAREVAAECAREVDRDPATIIIDDLPPARGDRALLRQVWVNLISNAIKYSGKQPEPRVHVWGTRDAASVTYHVRDNGVGFDMAYADKLFGVFQRLHRSADFPGTGVGLAIVMRVVQRHLGSVWGSAELGTGATFSFSLPMTDAS